MGRESHDSTAIRERRQRALAAASPRG